MRAALTLRHHCNAVLYLVARHERTFAAFLQHGDKRPPLQLPSFGLDAQKLEPLLQNGAEAGVSALFNERTRERGMEEFLDKKTYRPGLQAVKRPD